uniref:Uncharacterized protein n=1 Tax=Arundo donax TaxID=35708 RepID=A0A0A9CKH5_ARUDO
MCQSHHRKTSQANSGSQYQHHHLILINYHLHVLWVELYPQNSYEDYCWKHHKQLDLKLVLNLSRNHKHPQLFAAS